jgi:hypothetical protein
MVRVIRVLGSSLCPLGNGNVGQLRHFFGLSFFGLLRLVMLAAPVEFGRLLSPRICWQYLPVAADLWHVMQYENHACSSGIGDMHRACTAEPAAAAAHLLIADAANTGSACQLHGLYYLVGTNTIHLPL